MKTISRKQCQIFNCFRNTKNIVLYYLLCSPFISLLSAQSLRIDSVSVDSVWNSDSSWYDTNGIRRYRQSRDCMLSFIPVGAGTVQTVVSMSTDSGKTWITQIDGYNKVFQCGRKSNIKIRVYEGDKPGVAFKITGRQYKPVIIGNPKLIYYPDQVKDPAPVPGEMAAVPVALQLEDSSKGYAAVEKVYWDAMGDGVWDDSTESLKWIWNINVPQGDLGQRNMVIAKARDVYGFWNNPETLMVQFGGMRGTVFYEDFEDNLLKWETKYMFTSIDYYPQMRITKEVAHFGTHSITSDSNRTALVFEMKPRFESGVCGVEFYMMAKGKGQINFTVSLGLNGGSSGGLFYAFGIGFDTQDSVQVTSLDHWERQSDKLVSALQPGHWYKCQIEIDFSTKAVHYFIDDIKIDQRKLPDQEMYGIDRLLVFRGFEGGMNSSIPSKEGPMQYFVDDITVYKK